LRADHCQEGDICADESGNASPINQPRELVSRSRLRKYLPKDTYPAHDLGKARHTVLLLTPTSGSSQFAIPKFKER
jgi:hypothetical protein